MNIRNHALSAIFGSVTGVSAIIGANINDAGVGGGIAAGLIAGTIAVTFIEKMNCPVKLSSFFSAIAVSIVLASSTVLYAENNKTNIALPVIENNK